MSSGASRSLQKTIRDSIDAILLEIKSNSAALGDYELEVRFGRFTRPIEPWRAAVYRSLLAAGQEVPEYAPYGAQSSPFASGVDAEKFYAASQDFLHSLRGLCHTIEPLELSYTVVDPNDGTRYTKLAKGGNRFDVSQTTCTAMRKKTIARNDFVGMHRSDGMPLETDPEHQFLEPLRVALNYEQPINVTPESMPRVLDLLASSACRKRERRSLYLYDTSNAWHERVTKPVHNEWMPNSFFALYHEVSFAQLPRNPWRIDFTRVNDGDEHQIELELNFESAFTMAARDFATKHRAAGGDQTPASLVEAQYAYVRERISSWLGECLFRVQQAIDPATTARLCRQL